MSSYYEYQGVGVMIAHKLMKIDGWKVYGYHADESDSMTDYYSPAYWNGVAEKNGYILCVNVHGAREAEEIRKYNYTSFSYNKDIDEKIQKLKEITVERGACEEDERCAKVAILKLQKKAEGETENKEKYAVVGVIPGHLANPPRCNWHIEKDGIIIAKGNGLLKYAAVDDYYRYDRCFEDLNQWKADEEKYIANFIRDNMHRWNDTEERSRECALSHIAQLKKDDAIIQQFEAFINKIDTTCGGLLGEGDGVIYEKVTVTEYKKEIKAVETTIGSLKDGQCFILKASFNYGRYKGLVYRIHEIGEEGKKYFTAYKLNGKLTKECHGLASQNNTWYIGTADTITKWVDKGAISWCELKEVKTPYEVEKVVKKTIKAENKSTQKTSTKATEETRADIDNLTFKVSEDTDTRTSEKIYLVKVAEKLCHEDYIKVNKYINSLGGYYSKFKHAFLFKEDPAELLQSNGKTQNELIKERLEKQSKRLDRAKVIERINKAIDGTQNKIDKLSGDYKTNTFKRMREQEGREAKIQEYRVDMNILLYLLETVQDRDLTPLETALLTESFRDLIHSYYKRFKTWSLPEEKRPSSARPLEYPEKVPNYPNSWWNEEVPKIQKRLQKANISNTQELINCIEEYKVIFETVNKLQDQTALKIKRLERECKMMQKGDINFTPLEVAKKLVELASITDGDKVLEPSAGIASIADEIRRITSNIDVVEQMSTFRELLLLKGYNLVGDDFLQYQSKSIYDAIIMNPPFSDEQNHIKHAFDLLKDGGILVSISSPHWTFASDKKSVEFRDWLESEIYFTEDLMSGTFEMTGVASKIVVIEKHVQEDIKTA